MSALDWYNKRLQFLALSDDEASDDEDRSTISLNTSHNEGAWTVKSDDENDSIVPTPPKIPQFIIDGLESETQHQSRRKIQERAVTSLELNRSARLRLRFCISLRSALRAMLWQLPQRAPPHCAM